MTTTFVGNMMEVKPVPLLSLGLYTTFVFGDNRDIPCINLGRGRWIPLDSHINIMTDMKNGQSVVYRNSYAECYELKILSIQLTHTSN